MVRTKTKLFLKRKKVPKFYLHYFFLPETIYSTNMIYYNLCGIGSQHSNISKGKKVGGGVVQKEPYVRARKEPVVSTMKITFCLQFTSKYVIELFWLVK
jgi:hypothetical protein